MQKAIVLIALAAILTACGEQSKSVTVNQFTVEEQDDFVVCKYDVDVSRWEEQKPFVMIHAAVLDDGIDSREMGHSGQIFHPSRSGSIKERTFILDGLVNPYVVLVVTLTDGSGAVIHREAFTRPVKKG